MNGQSDTALHTGTQIRPAARAITAIFPGSFKPPHAGHIRAICHLLDEAAVTQVVVIISNRCRPIPGTDDAIDADAARVLLQNMLRSVDVPMERVRIEIAEHRAVSRALQFFDEIEPGNSLWFCVGTHDASAGDDRFARIAALSKEKGIAASVKVLPPAPVSVHSCDLRKHIAGGQKGQRGFCAELPPEMTATEKAAIWTECRASQRRIADIVKPKIAAALRNVMHIETEELTETKPRSVDPVFEYTPPAGAKCIIKYAGDTTAAGAFGQPLVQKPARRLAVEKRVLRHLRRHLPAPMVLPELIHFDRRTRISVLSRPPVSATQLATDIEKRKFDTTVAAKAGRLLAAIHGAPLPDEPFWGPPDGCHEHWNAVVGTVERQLDGAFQVPDSAEVPRELLQHCIQAAKPNVVHLQFGTQNVWRDAGQTGVENFECAASFGDQAYDLALFIVDYVVVGIEQDCVSRVADLINAFVRAYRLERQAKDLTGPVRLLIYVACLMLGNTSVRNKLGRYTNYPDCVVRMLKRIESGTEHTATETEFRFLGRMMQDCRRS